MLCMYLRADESCQACANVVCGDLSATAYTEKWYIIFTSLITQDCQHWQLCMHFKGTSFGMTISFGMQIFVISDVRVQRCWQFWMATQSHIYQANICSNSVISSIVKHYQENGLLSVQHQATIWTKAILSNLNQISIIAIWENYL